MKKVLFDHQISNKPDANRNSVFFHSRSLKKERWG